MNILHPPSLIREPAPDGTESIAAVVVGGVSISSVGRKLGGVFTGLVSAGGIIPRSRSLAHRAYWEKAIQEQIIFAAVVAEGFEPKNTSYRRLENNCKPFGRGFFGSGEGWRGAGF